MAGMATTLIEFSVNGDSKTYTTSGHTISKPKLVIQKRRVPVGNGVVSESTISVIHAAVDAAGNILPQKVVFSVVHKQHKDAVTADVEAALTILRDIVASDEFALVASDTGVVYSQNYLA